jgi:hypothetical protein
MVGARFVLYQFKKQFLQSSLSLGPNKEVFDAKVKAALAGIKVVLKLHTTCFTTNL